MDMNEATDPLALFEDWFEAARAAEPNDPNAMSLATIGAGGAPSVRIVLLKGFDAQGFVFYTNSESRKGAELAANAQAALCFHWKSLRRQVRIEGSIEPASAAEADAYFASRSRESRIGAWASAQSRPLASRAELEARVREVEARFLDAAVPRPAHWRGYRLAPCYFEFWHDRPHRLHDRISFAAEQGQWRRDRLYP
jgi:pyridoxamine 5'-phosphate oxidase